MRRYSLLRDNLFLFGVALYITNRWIIKPATSIEFFHASLNDLLCFPIWIPVLVSILSIVGVRPKGEAPRSYEILIPLLVWSWMFEFWLPATSAFEGVTIADHADVLWYALGALIGSVYWRVIGWEIYSRDIESSSPRTHGK